MKISLDIDYSKVSCGVKAYMAGLLDRPNAPETGVEVNSNGLQPEDEAYAGDNCTRARRKPSGTYRDGGLGTSGLQPRRECSARGH